MNRYEVMLNMTTPSVIVDAENEVGAIAEAQYLLEQMHEDDRREDNLTVDLLTENIAVSA